MRWVSLCSGIGGFDLALKNKKQEIVGACEIDKYARTIYARHFPGVKIYEDVTKLTGKEFGKIDGICAGFPCQTFSIAGRRLGFEESRGTIFFEIARIARQTQPRFLLLENVKGLLSHDNGRTFANILATLDELGYDAEWQVLNSKYFVPQNRERIFIIGYLRGTCRPKVFPISESNSINKTSHRKTQEKGKRLRSQISGTIDANYAKGAGSRTMLAWSKSHRTGKTKADKKRINYGKIEYRTRIDNTANCLNTGDGCRNQSTQTFVKEYEKIRCLTPLECESLQGFPTNWTEGISNNQRYKCIGNAVTVPVIEFILDRLIP